MYSPDGFISLEDIAYELNQHAAEWRLSTPHPDDPIPGGVVEGLFEVRDENWQRSAAYGEWLLHCFLNRHEMHLFACTSIGTPIKLSGLLVQRHHFFDGPFEDSKQGWVSTVSHLKDPFTFISRQGYTVSVEQAEKWPSVKSNSQLISIVRTLDSYPVCWRLPHGKPISDWGVVCGVSGSGAASNRSDMSPSAVARAILSTWTADKRLSKAIIKDLVAPAQSIRAFNLAWTIAVHEQPALALPGRKSSKS